MICHFSELDAHDNESHTVLYYVKAVSRGVTSMY